MIRSSIIIVLILSGIAFLYHRMSSDQINKLTFERVQALLEVNGMEIEYSIKEVVSDLERAALLPSFQQYQNAKNFKLETEISLSSWEISTFFSGLSARSPSYKIIRFLNDENESVVQFISGQENSRKVEYENQNFSNNNFEFPYSTVQYLGTKFIAGTDHAIQLLRIPIETEDENIGFIEIALDVDRLFTNQRTEKIFSSGYISSVDAQGNILSHPLLSVGEHLNKVEREAINVTNDLSFSNSFHQSKDGILTTFKVSELMNWKIMAVVPDDEVFADLNTVTTIVWGIIAFSIFVMMTSFFLVLRTHITKPLSRIRRVIQAVQKGDLSARNEKLSEDEIGFTGSAMNHMIDRIQAQIEENLALNRGLEQKVEEKTKVIEEERLQMAHTSTLAAVGVMAGGIAHEINNPLAVITLSTHLLRSLVVEDQIDTKRVVRQVVKIESMVERITKIINGLRNVSRVSKGDEHEMSNIKDILNDVIPLCQEKLKLHGTDLKIDEDSDLFELEFPCSRVQISQIFLNLISNAIDAIDDQEDKWIHIDFGQKLNNIEISLTDSGPGIPEEIKEKIFAPFFTTKEIGKGTGLGLSLSYNIMEKMGGKLFLDSKSKNTKFILSLPLS